MTLYACKDCDLLNALPERAATGTYLCARCGAVLRRHRPNCVDQTLALTLGAMILFIIANSFPFLAIESGGILRETTLPTGIIALWEQKFYSLSTLVCLTCVLIPLAQMAGLLYILAPLRWARPAPQAVTVFRLVEQISPWGLMEVFLLGVLVALVKLGKMATIIPGIAVYAFGALILVMAAAVSLLDPILLWEKLDRRR